MKEEIIKEVCEKAKVSLEEFTSVSMVQRFAKARFMAMHFLSHYGSYSPTEIGEMLGCRTHSTVLHGLERHKELNNSDKKYRIMFLELRVIFKARYPKQLK